jgi:hypothetical protein
MACKVNVSEVTASTTEDSNGGTQSAPGKPMRDIGDKTYFLPHILRDIGKLTRAMPTRCTAEPNSWNKAGAEESFKNGSWDVALDALGQELETMVPRAQQLMHQTKARVFAGDTVPTARLSVRQSLRAVDGIDTSVLWVRVPIPCAIARNLLYLL